jgi:acetyltransferase-like isoleucine patch superfamily enzyme
MHHSCELKRENAPYIVIGDEVHFLKNVWVSVAREAARREPIITLESRCILGRGCIVSAQNQIHVGRNTIFGSMVLVMDHNHGFEDITQPIRDQGTTPGGRIRIGEGCWIGHGAAIVCSAGTLELGPHCVVAANAVVTRSFPGYSVISGNPARIVKQFDAAKQTWVIGSAARTAETEPTK